MALQRCCDWIQLGWMASVGGEEIKQLVLRNSQKALVFALVFEIRIKIRIEVKIKIRIEMQIKIRIIIQRKNEN